MNSFREDLEQAVAYHGHLCSGQILGVRMARMALDLLGIGEPQSYRDLIVYVEMDRCIADAIGTVTGCKLGRRRLKWMDYGKTAASFLDLGTGKAVRIRRDRLIYPPEGVEGEAMIAFYEGLDDAALFTAQWVVIIPKPEDLPGKPLSVVRCELCGEEVLDGRQVTVEDHVFCRGCHAGHYYRPAEEHHVGTV